MEQINELINYEIEKEEETPSACYNFMRLHSYFCLDIDPNLTVALQLWGKMVGHLLLCILLFQTIEAKDGARLPPQTTKKWMTLNGRMRLTNNNIGVVKC